MGAIVRQSLASDMRIAPNVQALFFRRRHQPRRPPCDAVKPPQPKPVDGMKVGETQIVYI
jgi:hypothetical protein